MRLRMLGIAMLALAVLGTATFAQGPAQRRGMGGKRPGVGRIVKELGLSQAQADQVRAIVQRFHQDVKAIVQSSASREEKQTKVKDLRAKAGDEIMALLTPEQRDKATQMKLVDKLLSRRGAMAGMLMHMLAQLNLSETQKAQVKDIMKSCQEAGKAIREDATLTPEARRAGMRQLRQDTIEKIKAVLTPDQLTKFNELLAQRPGRNPRK